MNQLKEKFQELRIESKQVQNKQIKGPQKNNQSNEDSLISFECMICFNEFNDKEHTPIIICINQHNMCKKCVENKNYKKSVVKAQKQELQDVQVYQCPLCYLAIQQSKLRINNLLLQIYQWIKEIFKRQSTSSQLYTHQIQDFKNKISMQSENIDKMEVKNQQFIILITALNQENKFIKEKLRIVERQKIKCQSQQCINEEQLIQMYESILQKLKRNVEKKKINNQNKCHQEQVIKHQLIFDINTFHAHFSKFTFDPLKHQISMQGPFYRSFFQDFNFYYNVTQKVGIKFDKIKKLNKNQLIYFEIQIVQTKKGRFYIGFCGQQTSQKVNCHLFDDYNGIFLQDCSFICEGKQISKNQKQRIKNGQRIRVQLGFQLAAWYVNNQKIFQYQSKKLFTEQKQIFPVISMQMVGDKIRIVKN